MSKSPRVYETTSIDLASHLDTEGFPATVLNTGDKYCLFRFGDSPELRNAIVEYNRGGFSKRLLNSRSRLFREASEVMKRGVRHD